jgi:Spy/CpxP family protein refolding chaperone
MEEPMMTAAQRDELKTLCQKADVPDKSGELLTREGAQHFIENLKKRLTERK